MFVKINGTLYPATIIGKVTDREWDDRASKAITLEMDYDTAVALFVDGLSWSIVDRHEVPVYQKDENGELVLDEAGEPIPTGEMETQETEWDNSDYNLAGDLTDHRDGTVTAKMGKLTAVEEAYEILLGGN